MFTHGRDLSSPAQLTACARCGRNVLGANLVISGNWQQNNWWRPTPPAVPFASVFDREFSG